MPDNRNFILAIVLSIGVLIGWQYFVAGPQIASLQPVADEVGDRRAGLRQLGRKAIEPHEAVVDEQDTALRVDQGDALGDVGQHGLELARLVRKGLGLGASFGDVARQQDPPAVGHPALAQANPAAVGQSMLVIGPLLSTHRQPAIDEQGVPGSGGVARNPGCHPALR